MRTNHALFLSLCLVTLALQDMAGKDSAHYDTIAVVNVFRLRPPLSPVQQPPPPRAKVTLLGIVTYEGCCAILRVEPPVQSRSTEKPVVLTLKPGERDDKIELLEIDGKKRQVRLLNDGIQMDLAFESQKNI